MLDSCFFAICSLQFEVYIRYMGLDRLRFFSLDWASLIIVNALNVMGSDIEMG
ncbi:1262_t:CDS:2 [Gigaspora rosea]|nr:1262_t:CDS:2 [Gigaspora rosea]